MQQGGSQYGVSPEIPPFAAAAAPTASRIQMQGGGSTDQTHQSVAEEASPISSRPPAGNFDELMPVVPADDEALAAGDETDRGGISGMNRWPRQETLALIKIRSEMDAAFRDATLKGPLWDEVSRKLAELGYSRSAKKCKEKFENVHKYYKRTKEGRAGRQDGKSYRFFSQLEALHGTGATTSNTNPPPPTVAFVSTTTSTHPTSASTAATINLHATPVSVGIGISTPMPVSSVPVPFSISTNPTQAPLNIGVSPIFAPDYGVGMAPAAISGSARAAAATPAAGANVRSSFLSDGSSSSSSSGSEEEDEEEEFDFEGDPSRPESSRGRKRKRGSTTRGGLSSSQRIMEFFESLMKQVMQKQEAMQQRFLESIEKREQDRMIREEAWKRQEMARLAREHELMAQERAIAASRDSAIIAFLQKVTGQTIQLPHSTINIPSAPPPPPPSATMSPPPVQQQHHHQHKQSEQHQQQQQQQHRSQQQQQQQQEQENQPIISSEALMAVPEQQVPPQETSGGGGGSFDPTSSRWPKTEVLALIKLRSGLEGRYQEAGPKGPLWEEISAGMHRMGYKRSSKRCKEKWENINKYFKKVKESNKKRPEDAKTCPYFHELDALYRKKILGSGTSGGGGGGGIGSSGSSFGNQNVPEPQQRESMALDSSTTSKEQNKGDGNDMRVDNGGLAESLFRDGKSSAGEIAKKPEDIVKELMELQQQQQQHLQLRHQLMTDEYGRAEEPESENPNQEEDENYEDETDDEESEEDRKMSFKIEFQRQNPGPSNRGGNGAPSFVAMVQ